MQKISSGIDSLDRLIDSFYIGDNVVWEVDSGTPYTSFVHNFLRQSSDDSQKIIYVSFNRSPQSILNAISSFIDSRNLILVDCFTAGKGKNDRTFVKFYDDASDIHIVKIDNPRDIDRFTQALNSIEDSLAPGARYVIDSLTGMQDLWSNEDDTYKFFTYMCPRLYDLDTVAYWILDKEAHTQKFKANLRHITQVVIELYEKREMLYLKTLKLDRRQDREAFKPHLFEIKDGIVTVTLQKKEATPDIGSRLKGIRLRLSMSQKELADRVDVSPSFISQVENNQISPSMNSFVQICSALGVTPSALLEGKKEKKAEWLMRKRNGASSPVMREGGLQVFSIDRNGKTFDGTSFHTVVMEPDTEIKKHFMMHRGKEFIHVLKGRVSVVINGVEEILSAGDSVYLKEEVPSSWKNEMSDSAELLVIFM